MAAAQIAAAQEAARVAKEAREKDMKIVEESWGSLVLEEDSGEKGLPITDEDRKDAKDILRRFYQLLGNYTVTKLERVYNAMLEERYSDTKKQFGEDPTKTSFEEIMFHGTAPMNINKFVAPSCSSQ
jgi:hypothetical protein